MLVGVEHAGAEVIRGRENIEQLGIHFYWPQPLNDSLTPQADIYVTERGDRFSVETIASGDFLTWEQYRTEANTNPRQPGNLRSPLFPANDALYLGYYLRASEHDGLETDVYGWVAWDSVFNQFLTSINSIIIPNIVAVDSAAAIGADGIIVGTTIAIPEPTGGALLACLALAGSIQRRR